MNEKATQFHQGSKQLKSDKIILYHIITPINESDFQKIKQSGYFNPSRSALGGQSNGYYFFTTYQGAQNHIQTMKDGWESTPGKSAYIAECEINPTDIQYPKWMLDYEAMQDFMFDMIYDSATKTPIKFDRIEIKALDKKGLEIVTDGKFSRIKNFCANDHSGLIEKIADYLYAHDIEFKQKYNNLLNEAFFGLGNNQNLYAVKTKEKQKITKITKIENEPATIPQGKNSQISKFMERYRLRSKD